MEGQTISNPFVRIQNNMDGYEETGIPLSSSNLVGGKLWPSTQNLTYTRNKSENDLILWLVAGMMALGLPNDLPVS